MRILRIAERLPPLPGGKEIHVAELSRAQVTLGHEVTLRYRFGDPNAAGVPGQRTVARMPMRGLLGTLVFALASAWRGERLSHFDVVHAHGDWAEAWASTRALRGKATCVVLTVHGQLNPRYRHISRIAFSRVDAFIALGDAVRAELLDRGVPPERITILSSGLNTALLEPHLDSTRESGLIVTVGSLDPVKNIETQIRAVRSLDPNINVRLEVIGSGPEHDSLLEAAQGDARIHFLGHMSRQKVYERLAAAEIFLLSSRRLPGKGEGVSTALLEAMFLGCACVVSDEADPGSIIASSRNSASVPARDHVKLADIITELLINESKRTAMGMRAHDSVAGLSWTQRARDVEDVYSIAIASRNSHRD